MLLKQGFGLEPWCSLGTALLGSLQSCLLPVGEQSQPGTPWRGACRTVLAPGARGWGCCRRPVPQASLGAPLLGARPGAAGQSCPRGPRNAGGASPLLPGARSSKGAGEGLPAGFSEHQSLRGGCGGVGIVLLKHAAWRLVKQSYLCKKLAII